ncbi:peptide ABC transporter substrate-binding protein [Lactococcus nasutitermitis]|uniref:Peptide ABC transporter substrate-binding protein n=1 Tax=Lactococcus nasutitermitis TaxID=1652957 RepID=A0ABV9JFA8_9LACT|nr:peptide ABC transporter substrate-binding protein [Lactococcus nasutitermitis]
MKTWKKVGLGTVALVSVAVLAACGGSKSSSSRNPQLELTTDISTLDSATLTDTYSGEITGNTQEGLTRVNNKNVAVNAFAKSIKESSDGLTYTITLRDGLKWSDGSSLTAKDFIYAWQRAINPATGSAYAYLLSDAGHIKNAAEINSGKIKDLNQLGAVAKGNVITVTLTQPVPYFKFLLAEPVFYPVQKAAVDKYGKQYGTSSAKTVYSGPFIFKKNAGWTGTNESFSLVKNPNYYDKKDVKSKEIDFQVVKNPNTAVQLYKSGKLDETPIASPDLYAANKDYNGGKDYVPLKEATTAYIEYNQSGKGTSNPTAAKALQNQDIREAINLATNRKDIVSQFYPGSTPATGFVPANMAKTSTGEDFSKYAAQPYTYDVAKAKELWTKGLKEIGATKVNLTYTTDADKPVAKQTADYLQTSLAKALPGLTITEKIVPFQQRLKDSQTQNFDMVLTLWGGDYAEPSTFLNLFLPTSGQNDGKVNNPAYVAAFNKAATLPDVLDDAARNADYKDAEKALYEESSFNPVYFRTTPSLKNPDLKGLTFHGTGLNYDLKSVYIKK